MGGLSDQMLSGGCVPHIERIHGEQIQVLSGPDAGKFFGATLESEADDILQSALGPDVRAKWFVRFDRAKTLPNLTSQDSIKDSAGKVWKVVQLKPGSYLTLDYEIIEVVDGLDT